MNKPLTLVLNMTPLIPNKDNSISLFSLYKDPLNKLTSKRQHNERAQKTLTPNHSFNSRNQTATQWLVKYGSGKKDWMHHNNLSHLQIKYLFFSVSIHFAFRSRQTSLLSLEEDCSFQLWKHLKKKKKVMQQDLKTEVLCDVISCPSNWQCTLNEHKHTAAFNDSRVLQNIVKNNLSY